MTSIDPREIHHFNRIAADWWDPEGAFKPLHQMNLVRLKFIRQQILEHFQCESQNSTPFKGLTFLDVGCGGGLVTEPLARLGGEVTGLDAGEEAIRMACEHSKGEELSIDYHNSSAEEWAAKGVTYDVVLALEIIEHVADPGSFLKACAALVKPGGVFILSTLNRTLKSYLLAILGAEYLLRWAPRGTHQWEKFLKPSEVARYLREAHVEVTCVQGVVFNPLSWAWRLSQNTDVNYLLTGIKK